MVINSLEDNSKYSPWESESRASNWMLMCSLNIILKCDLPVPVTVPGLLPYDSLLYVMLLDGHHAMYVFFMQAMRSAKHIMLLQLCCVQLSCVAAVFRDNMCLTTTHNRLTHIQYTTYSTLLYCTRNRLKTHSEMHSLTRGHFVFPGQPTSANRSGPPISG